MDRIRESPESKDPAEMTPQEEKPNMPGAEAEAVAETSVRPYPPPPDARSSERDDRDTERGYTIANILAAGRRAEGSGHRDYAIQFYTHLAEHHPATPEGKEARDSLERLTGAKPKPARDLRKTATLLSDATAPVMLQEAPPLPKGESLARLAYRGDDPPPLESEPAAHLHPAGRRNYKLGKFLARVLSGFGLFLVVTGVVVPLVALAGQPLGPLSMDVSGAPLAVFLAPVAIGLGVGMMVASQAAFAVFEQAEGLRRLRKMERAMRAGEV